MISNIILILSTTQLVWSQFLGNEISDDNFSLFEDNVILLAWKDENSLPLWNTIFPQIQDLQLVHINCLKEVEICAQFDIEQYPSIIHIFDSTITHYYEGQYEQKELIPWIMDFKDFQNELEEDHHHDHHGEEYEIEIVMGNQPEVDYQTIEWIQDDHDHVEQEEKQTYTAYQELVAHNQIVKASLEETQTNVKYSQQQIEHLKTTLSGFKDEDKWVEVFITCVIGTILSLGLWNWSEYTIKNKKAILVV